MGGEERGSGRRPEGGKDAEGGGEGQLSQEGGKDGKKQNPVGRVMAPPTHITREELLLSSPCDFTSYLWSGEDHRHIGHWLGTCDQFTFH